jgi:hypothetical protein
MLMVQPYVNNNISLIDIYVYMMQAIKLQVNSGEGGCFPCHFDSDEQVDGRKVTAIIYLNST